MRDADLVPPDLLSESGRFKIVLRHRSVFSDSDQRWLDDFKPFKLTREEMLVMLLGREGNLLSPQQIYDRLSLVDWDVYREIIEGMQLKGLLYNAFSEVRKKSIAQKKRVSQREVPRIIVRQPEECEKSLKQLFEVLSERNTSQIDRQYLEEIKHSLPVGNIYGADTSGNIRFGQSLTKLGLVDEERNPTALLVSLWQSKSPTKSLPHIPESQMKGPVIQRAAKVNLPIQPKEQPVIPQKVSVASAELFVGNVNYEATVDELKALFSKCGQVTFAKIPVDFVTGHGRGFGFVCMADASQAESAILQLNGQPFKGWRLRVLFQRPKVQ